jgi:hypothetical protein
MLPDRIENGPRPGVSAPINAIWMVAQREYHDILVKWCSVFLPKLHLVDGSGMIASVELIPVGYWLIVLVED